MLDSKGFATMLDDIPLMLSVSLAAKVVGLSRAAFTRHYIETGLIKEGMERLDGPRLAIWRWELEKALGRTLTLEECRAADAKLNPARRRQRLYQRKKGNR